jgi:hypothetical protein
MAELQSSQVNPIEDQEFSMGPFLYKTKYNSDKDKLKITAIHTKEFFTWKTTIKEPLKSMPESEVGYNLSSKHLAKILCDLKNGKINEYLKVHIQDNFEDDESNLEIHITIFATYDTNLFDKKTLVLEPQMVTSEQRLMKKLDQRDDLLFKMNLALENLTERVKKLEEKPL